MIWRNGTRLLVPTSLTIKNIYNLIDFETTTWAIIIKIDQATESAIKVTELWFNDLYKLRNIDFIGIIIIRSHISFVEYGLSQGTPLSSILSFPLQSFPIAKCLVLYYSSLHRIAWHLILHFLLFLHSYVWDTDSVRVLLPISVQKAKGIQNCGFAVSTLATHLPQSPKWPVLWRTWPTATPASVYNYLWNVYSTC